MLFVAHLTSFDLQMRKKSVTMKFPYYSVLFHIIITYILDLMIESQCSDNIWLFNKYVGANNMLTSWKTNFIMQ